MSNSDDNSLMSKKSLCSSGRKSLLLPLNTIKDAHIRKSIARLRQSNSRTHCLNQTHALPTVHESKYSRISEDLPSMGSTSVPVLQKGNNRMSVIQHTSSRTFNVNNQFGICSLSSPCFNLTNANNDAMGRRILERANSDQALDAKIQSNQDSDCNIKSYKLRASSIWNTNTRTDTELHNERFLDLDAKAAHMITSAEKTKDRMHSVKDNNKAGRPIREYMAMKLRMRCLLTPNIKRFNPLMSEKDTQLEAGGAKASLSNKIFAELHNLYADSPDSR